MFEKKDGWRDGAAENDKLLYFSMVSTKKFSSNSLPILCTQNVRFYKPHTHLKSLHVGTICLTRPPLTQYIYTYNITSPFQEGGFISIEPNLSDELLPSVQN